MGVFSPENIKFLQELEITPRKMTTIIEGDDGHIKIQCNFCGDNCDKAKDVTKHLLYECSVAGLKNKSHPGKKQIGGKRLKHLATEKYELTVNPRLFSDDELERKAFEMVGFYRKEGARREDLVAILQEFARQNRQVIRKKQLEAYLRDVIRAMELRGTQQMQDPNITVLLNKVYELEMYLQNCMSRMGSAQSNIAFASTRQADIAPMQKKISDECENLRREIAQLEQAKTNIDQNLKECQEDLAKKGVSPTVEIASSTQSINETEKALEQKIQEQESEIAKLNALKNTSKPSDPVAAAMLEKAIQTSQNEVKKLSENVDSLQSIYQSVKSDSQNFTQTSEQMRNLSNRTNDAERRASDAQSRASLAEVSVRSKERQLSQKIQEVNSLQEQINNLTGDREGLNEQINTLQSKLTAANETNAKQVGENSNLLSQVKKCQSVLESMRSNIPQMIQFINQLIDKINEINDNNVKLTKIIVPQNLEGGYNLENVNEKLKEMFRSLNEIQKQKESLKAAIAECESRIRRTSQQMESTLTSAVSNATQGNKEALLKLQNDLKISQRVNAQLTEQSQQKEELIELGRSRQKNLQTEIDKLNQQKESQNAQLNEYYSSQNSEAQSFKTAISDLKSENQTLGQQMMNYEEELNKCKEELKKYIDELHDAKVALKSAKSTHTSIIEEVQSRTSSKLSGELGTLTNENRRLKDDLKTLQKLHQNCKQSESELRQSVATASTGLSIRSSEFSDEITSLQSQLTTERSARSNASIKTENLQNELRRCEEKKAALEMQLRHAQSNSEAQRLTLENQSYTERIKILTETLQDEQNINKQLELNIGISDRRLEEVDKELAKKQAEIKRLQEENAKLQVTEAETQAFIRNQTLLLDVEATDLKQEVNELKKSLDEKEALLTKFEKKIIILEKELIEKKANANEVNNTIAELNKKISSLEFDRDTYQREKSTAQNELHEARIKLAELEQKQKVNLSEITDLEEQIKSIRGEKEKAERDLQDCQSKLSENEQKLKECQAEKEALEEGNTRIVDRLNEKIQELTTDKNALQTKLNSSTLVDRSKITSLEEEIAALKKAKREEIIKLQKCEGDLSSLIRELEVFIDNELGTKHKVAVATRDKIMEDLRQAVNILKTTLGESEKVKKERDRLNDRIADVELERDSAQAEIIQLKTNISTIQNAQSGNLTQIQADLNAKTSDVTRLEGELRTAKSEVIREKRAKEAAEVRATTAESSLAALEGTATQRGTTIAERDAELKRLRNELASLTGLHDTAEATIREKERELSEKDATYQSLETEKTTLEAEVSRLNSEVSRLNSEISGASQTKGDCEKELAKIRKELDRVCGDQLVELKATYSTLVSEAKFLETKQGKYEQMDLSLYNAISGLQTAITRNDPAKMGLKCDDSSERIKVKGQFRILMELKGKMEMATIISNAAKKKSDVLTIESCKEEAGQLDGALKQMGHLPDIITGIKNALETLKQEPESEVRAKKLNYLSVVESKINAGQATTNKIDEIKSKYADFSPSGPAAISAANALKTYNRISEKVEGKKLTPSDKSNVEAYNSACTDIKNALISIKQITDKYIDYINDFEDISGSVRVYVRINDYTIKSGENISSYIKSGSRGNCENEIVFNKSICALGSGVEIYGPFFGTFMCMSNEMLYRGLTFNLTACKGTQGLVKYTDKKYLCNLEARGIRSTIRQVLDGYRIATFGYGYSGSGKTYTLYGSGTEQPGLVQIALNDIKDELRGIEIISIRELYGQGSIRGIADYPIRTKGEIGDDYYIREFEKISGNPNIGINGLKLNDVLTANSGKITLKINQVSAAIAFINQKLTLDRMITGRIKATPNNPESSRGHLFVTFRLHKKSGGFGDFIVCDMGGIEDVGAIVESYFGPEAKKFTIITNSLDVDTFKIALKDSYIGPGPADATEVILNNEIGKIIKTEYDGYIQAYGNDEFKNIDLEKAYVTVGQMLNKKENISQLLFEKYKPDWIQYIDKNDSRIKDISNKYGLDLKDTEKKLVILRIRFNGKLIDDYLGGNLSMVGYDNQLKEFLNFRLEQIKDVIREGFYINESLNHMKAYFKDKIGGYQTNYSNKKSSDDEGYAEEILKHLNSSFNEMLVGKNWISKRVENYYNKNRYFYLPYFEKGIPKNLWVEYLTRDVSEIKLPQMTNTKEVTQAVNLNVPGGYDPKTNVKRGAISDPIGMLTFLQDIATSQFSQTKPSKFIMMALLLPNIDPRYCSGAEAALEFAQSVTSTRGHQTPRGK